MQYCKAKATNKKQRHTLNPKPEALAKNAVPQSIRYIHDHPSIRMLDTPIARKGLGLRVKQASKIEYGILNGLY